MSEKEEIGSVEGEHNVTVPPIELASQKTASDTTNITPTKKTPRSKWLLPAIIAAAVLILVGGGSYGYFAVYLQSPENLWNDGLANTHKGLESYVNAKQPLQSTGKVSGTFTVTSPFGADGKIEGSFDDKNAELTAEVGAVGVRPTFELRTITEEGAKSPDMYIKLSGTVPVGSLVNNISPEAAGIIKNLDNKWYVVDRTIFDSAKEEIVQQPLPEVQQLDTDVRDAAKKAATILKDSLFSTEESKAVLKVTETLKKEDFKGRKAQHVKVQVQKEQFKTMITSLKDVFKGTSIEKFVTNIPKEQQESVTSGMTFDALVKELDTLNYEKAVADVWIDTGLRYIRNVRITSTNGENDVVTYDFMLDYTGGDELPLSITVFSKNASTENTLQLGMKLNQKNNNIDFTATAKGTIGSQKLDVTAALTVQNINEKVSPQKPEDATNIMELLGGATEQFKKLQEQFMGTLRPSVPTKEECDAQDTSPSSGASEISEACLKAYGTQ